MFRERAVDLGHNADTNQRGQRETKLRIFHSIASWTFKC